VGKHHRRKRPLERNTECDNSVMVG
jgi:hypothetical protein